MDTLTFKEVAELINLTKTTNIDPISIKNETGKWELFKGKNKVTPFEYEFFVLYFFADATIESINKAVTAIKEPTKTQVVYAISLDKKFANKKLSDLVGSKFASVTSTRDYLYLFIKDKMECYCKQFSDFPKFYVEPQFITPSGFRRKFPNPLLNFLNDETGSGDVAVLFGEPGQGKTYTTEYLAAKLYQQGSIPIYIQSNQWSDLSTSDLTSLWKTIAYSFKYHNSAIEWIDGHEKEFLNVTLKSGIFKIIFDGLDEYILWNKGTVDPQETIDGISGLAKSSGSKILVTTRTSFWNTLISESDAIKNNESIYSYEMVPFDRSKAQLYFNSRFKDDKQKINYCIRVFEEGFESFSSGREGSFVGRGFVLNLIADLAERSDSYSLLAEKNKTFLQWIVSALCQREEIRQRLPLNASEQITICREFSEHIACGGRPTTEDLLDTIRICKDTLPEKQLNFLVNESAREGSLKDHPLIRKFSDGWGFVHEQIYFNLLAEQICAYVKGRAVRTSAVIEKIEDKGSLFEDIANAIVEQEVIKGDDGVDELKKVIKILIELPENSFKNHNGYLKAKKFATHIALITLDTILKKGEQHKKRIEMFLELLNQESIYNLVFSRVVSRMDFSGLVFRNCLFDKVTFANCTFSENTIFEKCSFEGGNITYCNGFGLAKFLDTKCDVVAEKMIKTQQINDGSKNYNDDDLKHDISEFLLKFTDKGKSRIKTLHESNFFTGIFGKSQKRFDISKMLKKHVLEPHHVSGSSEPGYNVNERSIDSFKNFLTNGVFTGSIADAYNELKIKLKL